MSRPPGPPLNHPYSTPSSPAMAETQSAPSIPPPPFLDYSHRRLPQPIQLPPLSIPPQSSPRPDHHGTPPPSQQPLPGMYSGGAPPPSSGVPPPRSQPRSYSGPAAPLDKLLSPHPYTPPRSDSAYSPQRSPPRSTMDSRLPPRRAEDPRTLYPDQAYVSPVEPHRSSYSSLPSPASSYATSYTSSNPQYRPVIPPPGASGPPAYASPAYSEPAPPPQVRISHDHHSHGYPPAEKSSLQYELRVRQQPIAARACGFGERDRRVIDPPPIIQLLVTDPKTGTVDLDELRYSLNVVHCTLWNADGTNEETALIQPDRRVTRRLMGQLVASPSVAKDEHDVEGCFFCFPDLSCRTHGKYRLRFVLMRIDPTNLHVGGFSPILTEVLSDVFTVYTAKDFPGMRPSSALTRALKLQGCNIQVKKGNEKALARKRISPSSEEEEGEDGKRGKRRKEV